MEGALPVHVGLEEIGIPVPPSQSTGGTVHNVYNSVWQLTLIAMQVDIYPDLPGQWSVIARSRWLI